MIDAQIQATSRPPDAVYVGAAAPGAVIPTVTAITPAAAPAVNAALGNVFTLAIDQNSVMAAPTSPTVGQQITIVVTQDNPVRTLGWNAVYLWPGGITPTLTAVVGAVDMFSGIYDGTSWLMTSAPAFA